MYAAGSPQLYKRFEVLQFAQLHIQLTTSHTLAILVTWHELYSSEDNMSELTGHYNLVSYYTDDKIGLVGVDEICRNGGFVLS